MKQHENDVPSAPLHRSDPPKMSNYWIILLLLCILFITFVHMVPLLPTISRNYDMMVVFEYASDSLHPFSIIIFLLVALARPLRTLSLPFPWRAILLRHDPVLSIFFLLLLLQLIFKFQTNFLNKNTHTHGLFEAVSLGSFVYVSGYFFVVRRVQKLSTVYLTQLSKNRFVLEIAPKIIFSTMLSMIYITMESFGCLAENTTEPLACENVFSANTNFCSLLCAITFLRLLILPFSRNLSLASNEEENQFLQNILKFDFDIGEQICLVMMSILLFIAISFYSAAAERDLSLPNNFIGDGKSGMFLFAILVALSAHKIPTSWGGNLTNRRITLQTTLRGRLAPIYRIGLVAICGVLLSQLGETFYHFVHMDSTDINLVMGSQMRARGVQPILLLTVVLFCFSAPFNSSRLKEKICFWTASTMYYSVMGYSYCQVSE